MLIDELKTALDGLRSQWVLSDCLARLQHDSNQHPKRERYHKLRRAAGGLALEVEAVHALMAHNGLEAAYHNRLHFADTLWCMTALLLACRQASVEPRLQDEQEMLAILVMVGHDFHHDGRVNQHLMEMENRSVTLAAPVLDQFGIAEDDLECMKRLVQHTDPTTVAENHSVALQRPFSIGDQAWLQVLANEADVLASSLPDYGESLGEALSREWAAKHADMAKSVISPAGRLYFLEKVAIFSTPGSRRLGLQQLREMQIAALKQTLNKV
ncbi:MAG: hypothetical protein RL585_1586 [Pseudomonadota bacterium]